MKNKVLRIVLPGLIAVMSMGCYGMDVPISQPLIIEVSNQTGHQLNINEMTSKKQTKVGNLEEKRISLLPISRIKPNGSLEKFPERFTVINTKMGSYKLVIKNYVGTSQLIISKIHTKEQMVLSNPRKPILIFEPKSTMPTVQELE